MAKVKRKSVADLLREKIRGSGMTLTDVAERTGVPQPRLTVFMQGNDIRLETAQKLMDYFKITVK